MAEREDAEKLADRMTLRSLKEIKAGLSTPVDELVRMVAEEREFTSRLQEPKGPNNYSGRQFRWRSRCLSADFGSEMPQPMTIANML